MPTYNHIADYINNRLKALGDNNDIDALKRFVNKNLIYDPVKTDINELFVIGTDYGIISIIIISIADLLV